MHTLHTGAGARPLQRPPGGASSDSGPRRSPWASAAACVGAALNTRVGVASCPHRQRVPALHNEEVDLLAVLQLGNSPLAGRAHEATQARFSRDRTEVLDGLVAELVAVLSTHDVPHGSQLAVQHPGWNQSPSPRVGPDVRGRRR